MSILGIFGKFILPVTAVWLFYGYQSSPVSEAWPLNWGPLPLSNGQWPGDMEHMHKASRRVLVGQVTGAESFAFSPDRSLAYTGTLDGRLLELDLSPLDAGGDPVIKRVVAEFGDGTLTGEARDGICGNYDAGLTSWETCGRVLSVEWDFDGEALVVMDVSGVVRVDPVSGAKTLLFSSGDAYLNTVVPSKDGSKLWLSRSSSVYTVYRASLPLFRGEPDGQIWEVDRASGKVTVLARDLVYPNGLTATKDERALLVNELGNVRVLRVELEGGMKGSVSTVVENLPGMPDNITLDPEGNFYIAFSAMRSIVTQTLIEYGWTRKLAAGLIPDHRLPDLAPRRSGVMHFREDGTPLHVWYDMSSAVNPYTSEAVLWKDGVLLMGSFRNNFISIFDTKQD